MYVYTCTCTCTIIIRIIRRILEDLEGTQPVRDDGFRAGSAFAKPLLAFECNGNGVNCAIDHDRTPSQSLDNENAKLREKVGAALESSVPCHTCVC